MKMKRIRRLAFTRRGDSLAIHRPGSFILRDYSEDHGLINGEPMFRGLEVGKIVLIETFAFTHIGELVHCDDVSITLKDSVRVLYDGRTSELMAGKPPASAEIEKNLPIQSWSADFVGGWGTYPAKTPKPQ
jgi:hypothetical protein